MKSEISHSGLDSAGRHCYIFSHRSKSARIQRTMNNTTGSEARLKSILDRVRKLKAKYYKRAKKTGENFNVFSILDRERKEVTTHSAIIAELLNPHGSHSQGVLFLKLFLDKFQEEQTVRKELDQLREKLEHIREDEFDKFEVEVETPKKDKKGKPLGQIDILIESGDICIVIENKICADDQRRQLGRYYEYALDTGKKHGVIYLTLGGDEPKKFTLYGAKPDKMPCCGMLPENTVVCPKTRKLPTPPRCKMLPKDRVICLSYKEFIDEWLGACIKKVACIPRIRETLHQYQMTVKKLTGQPINRRFAVELKDILLENENYNLIPDLEDAISEAKTHLQCKFFWSKLEYQLKERQDLNIVNRNLRYEVYGTGLGIDPKYELEACIRECSNQNSPGLTFSLDKKGDREIVFRINCSPATLYYGFVLYEKGKRVKINGEKRREYPDLDRYKIDGGGENVNGWPDAGWLAHKYSEYPVIDFKSYKSVTKYKIRTEEVVEKLVAEICDVVKEILNKQE